MPRAAKPCRKPSCPNVRPCPIQGHEPQAWAGSNRRAQLPPDWNRRAAAVIARDPTCTICREKPSTDCHHTGDPLDHRLENLAGVCRDCHKTETARQAAAARRRNT